MSEFSLEEAEALTQEAFAALEAGHYDRVLELTAQLRALQFSSYFEIEALLYLDQNQPGRALQILDEGTQVVPDLWLLWQLRGNVLSDLKRFDDALESYDKASPLEGADVSSLRLNRATAMWRDGRAKAALREIEGIGLVRDTDALDLRWRLNALLLGLWADLGRCDEAKEFAARLWQEQLALEVDPEQAGQLSLAFSQIGWALRGCGQNQSARDWADAALGIDRSNGQALLLKRDATPDLPLADQIFRVMLRGTVQGEDEALGFYTTIYVVASDVSRAEKMALEFETFYWEAPLEVEESERLGGCDLQPSCVYRVDGRVFYPLDADE